MRKNKIGIIGAFGVLAAIAIASRSANAGIVDQWTETPEEYTPEYYGDDWQFVDVAPSVESSADIVTPEPSFTDIVSEIVNVNTNTSPGAIANSNVAAFLKMIRVLESQDNYGAIVGGGTITDFREHPWVLDPSRPLVRINGVWSNASGAYQFLAATPSNPKAGTWQGSRDQAGVRDFSPASQDKAAVVLLKWRRAYDDVVAGRFGVALTKVVKEWESVEKMLANAYPITTAQAKNIYLTAGGSIAGSTVV